MTKTDKNSAPSPSSPVIERRESAESDRRTNALSPEEPHRLIHELQVHQIELENQNEELRRMQEELEHSQGQYFDLYDLAPVGYLMLNDKGLILETNTTATKLLGTNKSALVKHPLNPFIVPEDQALYYRYFRELMTGKAHNICELCMLRADGGKIWVRLRTTTTIQADGTLQLRTVMGDITECTLAQTALRESEERLSLAMEASDQGFWDWDIANNRAVHNHKWYELLGLNDKSGSSSPSVFSALLHDDDREAVLARLKNALENNGRFKSEHRLRRADGCYIWVLENGIVVKRDNYGKPLRMVGSFTDISERKQHEQQQREYQNQYERLLKLEAANQTVAAIAHDLNQPLSAAASYADAAQRYSKIGNEPPEKLVYALDQSVLQIRLAGQAVHELFRFLRAGETTTAPLDLNRLVRGVIATLKEDHLVDKFKVIFDLEKSMPLVNANALQLEKTLINLVRNGIEAMYEAGLPPEAIRITACTFNNGTDAEVTISDNGPGLDAEAAKRIFEPFYSTKAHGLGMGLAISRALIEAQGGRLWCQADVDCGAVFHLTLPFASETPS
jgi:PAS domain S-box-containing protein